MDSSGKTHKVVPTGNPSAPYTIKLFSDIGTEHPFVSRVLLGLNEVIDATLVSNPDEIKWALGDLMVDCLMPAFVSLRELRKSFDDEQVPELTKTKHFNDMYGSLWSAYKDRMQKVIKLLGFKVGFLFQNDKAFEQGCKKFCADHPEVDSNFCEVLKWHRDHWQNELATFRNKFLEHQVLKATDVKKFYSLKIAEQIFDCVWIAIEDVVAFLAGAKLGPSIRLAELPDSRGTTATKRFGFVWAERVKFEPPPENP
jgi:hypothetical protein